MAFYLFLLIGKFCLWVTATILDLPVHNIIIFKFDRHSQNNY